jgi:hypothetical protein
MRAAGTVIVACLCMVVLTSTANAGSPRVAWADAAGGEGLAHLRQWEAGRRTAAHSAAAPAATGIAHAAAVWAACGWRDKDDKLVRLFQRDHRRDFALRCGNADRGYRHIRDRHMGDFERMAAGTFQNWRDVADLSLAANSSDPDVIRPAGGNQTCRSRVIFLINVRNGQTVRQQIVRMFTDNGTSEIRSAFPSPHCP